MLSMQCTWICDLFAPVLVIFLGWLSFQLSPPNRNMILLNAGHTLWNVEVGVVTDMALKLLARE
jgi:hypothetical protein